jgi:outer membrane lipoprotein-sorting protein
MFIPLKAEGNKADEDKGLSIVRQQELRDNDFKDFIADLCMVLKNQRGQESRRLLRIQALEVQGDGDKLLTIFDKPKDIKGTAFLTFSHKFEDDDQWLYLPTIKRVKRVSARNKSGSFVGSEFAYEDISSQEVEKYTYKWIRDEVYQGQECFVIERFPLDKKNSGYIRQVVWIDKREYRNLKIDYFDRKDFLLKTQTFTEYEKYADRYWHANEMKMVNHQNGKSTDLLWSNYTIGVGLDEKNFTKSRLGNIK